jgi:hypothetical protein
MRQLTSSTKRKVNRAKLVTRHKWWTKEAHAERIAEAERIASLVEIGDFSDPERQAAYDHFWKVFRRAVEEGGRVFPIASVPFIRHSKNSLMRSMS